MLREATAAIPLGDVIDFAKERARLEKEYPANKGEGIIVNQFMNEVVGNVRPTLLTLLGAVGLVLLIACANVSRNIS